MKAKELKRVSEFGSIWKPAENGKIGDKLRGIIERHHWEKDKEGDFPATDFADIQTGELFSLRVDKAFLRIIQRIAVGSEVEIIYEGLGEKKGKRNAPEKYAVFTNADLEQTSFFDGLPKKVAQKDKRLRRFQRKK